MVIVAVWRWVTGSLTFHWSSYHCSQSNKRVTGSLTGHPSTTVCQALAELSAHPASKNVRNFNSQILLKYHQHYVKSLSKFWPNLKVLAGIFDANCKMSKFCKNETLNRYCQNHVKILSESCSCQISKYCCQHDSVAPFNPLLLVLQDASICWYLHLQGELDLNQLLILLLAWPAIISHAFALSILKPTFLDLFQKETYLPILGAHLK